jgi:hypothetical protein
LPYYGDEMKYVKKLPRLFLAIFTTSNFGCGGLGEPGTAFAVIPENATTTPGGTVNISVVVANADVLSYRYKVVGGAVNGTVAPNFNDRARAVYTAPQTPGAYTVEASFTQFGGQVYTGTVAITVQ